MRTSERRRATRLALPKGSVSGVRASGRILDVSSAGVRVEVDTRCVFARGELHRLVLSDLLESVEVEGQVRWTQSHWRDSGEKNGSEYFQTAGLAFSRLLSDQPAGIWSGLLAGMPRPVKAAERAPAPPPGPKAEAKRRPLPVEMIEEVPVAPASEPVQQMPVPAPLLKPSKQTPALEMIEPSDGYTASQPSIKVICTIEKPEMISGFRINGIDAFVMGDLGTAEVKLQKGANRILSMVSRRDGTYSTYLLGTVYRSPDH